MTTNPSPGGTTERQRRYGPFICKLSVSMCLEYQGTSTNHHSRSQERFWPYAGGIAKENRMKALAIGGGIRGVQHWDRHNLTIPGGRLHSNDYPREAKCRPPIPPERRAISRATRDSLFRVLRRTVVSVHPARFHEVLVDLPYAVQAWNRQVWMSYPRARCNIGSKNKTMPTARATTGRHPVGKPVCPSWKRKKCR
jgi:hypothetical protein